MEILGHVIDYKLYNHKKMNNGFKKDIFNQIYKKHLNFGLLYSLNGKVIGKWGFTSEIKK